MNTFIRISVEDNKELIKDEEREKKLIMGSKDNFLLWKSNICMIYETLMI